MTISSMTTPFGPSALPQPLVTATTRQPVTMSTSTPTTSALAPAAAPATATAPAAAPTLAPTPLAAAVAQLATTARGVFAGIPGVDAFLGGSSAPSGARAGAYSPGTGIISALGLAPSGSNPLGALGGLAMGVTTPLEAVQSLFSGGPGRAQPGEKTEPVMIAAIPPVAAGSPVATGLNLSTIQASPAGKLVAGTPGAAPHSADHAQSSALQWSSASPQQQQEAQAAINTTRQTASKYKDVRTALADGYTMAIYQPESGWLHLANPAKMADGKVGDPNEPEAFVYHVAADGTPTLHATLFTKTASETSPSFGINPDWHDHAFLPGLDMLHVWEEGSAPDPFGNVEPKLGSQPPATSPATVKLQFGT